MPSPIAEWIPTPSEIRERCAQLQWLRTHGFHVEPWSSAIMIYETPSLPLVQAMVARYGIDETRRRLRPYLQE